MDILDILTKLEASVSGRTRVPVTGKSLVDTNQLSQLTRELRQAIPKDIQEAQEVLQRREELLNQALAEAGRIRALAEEEIGGRLEQSEVAREARQHADKIIAEGREHAQQIVAEAERRAQKIGQDGEGFAQERAAGADQYTREVLFHLEAELSQLLGSVRKGIDSLELDRQVRT